MFGRERPVVARYIKNVFSDNELDEKSVCAKIAQAAPDDKTYQGDHYSLDVIIFVGYRVKSRGAVLACASLPDDVAYRLAKALHQGHAALAAKLDQAQESTLENTLAAAPTRELIHPGVLKYMKEVGL